MNQSASQNPQITSPLRGEVGALRRVRGSALAQSTTANVRTLRQNQTEAETAFWNMVRNRAVGGHKFVRQFAIDPYAADFVCRAEKLIVEIDGGQHDESTADAARTAFLNQQGYSVLRFWNNEVLGNLDGCHAILTDVLCGNPSPERRFAPVTLSPKGRGEEEVGDPPPKMRRVRGSTTAQR